VAVCKVTETEPVKLPPLGLKVGAAAVGKLTTKLNEVVFERLPAVALMVMGKFPAGVEPVVLTVRVVEQLGLQLAEEKEPDVPVGNPETEKETSCGLPDTSEMLITLVTDDPAVSALLPVLAVEKSKGSFFENHALDSVLGLAPSLKALALTRVVVVTLNEAIYG
jgi:hypothetical protein